MIIDSITEVVGNTPLCRIPQSIHGYADWDVYAKLEYLNPFGSVKDRVGLALFQSVVDDAKRTGKTILESSSGNTGKAVAALCAMEGLPFLQYTNRVKVPEQRMLLQMLGSEVRELPGVSDCPDPNDPKSPLKMCADLVASQPDRYVYLDQYFSANNPNIHYQTTAAEILRDLSHVDLYCGPLGTCGSSQGIARALREKNQSVAIVGAVVAPGNSVPGARNENELWEVGLYRPENYDRTLTVPTSVALDAMLTLNRRCGILCGPSSGLSFAALKKSLDEMRNPHGTRRGVAVFMVCDRVESYMSYLKRYMPELFSAGSMVRPTVDGQRAEDVLSSEEISPQELFKRRAQGAIVIDIRGALAFMRARIANSWNILDELFAAMIEEGPALPRQSQIVVVCAVGTISRKFASFLAAQGYEASSLCGGIQAWRAAGFPLTSGAECEDACHVLQDLRSDEVRAD